MENNDNPTKKIILENDLKRHTRYFFKKHKNYSFTLGKFHEKVMEAFQDVIMGKCHNLMILMPPRHSKTEMAKYFATMGFACNPASEFIYACADKNLALACSSEIRNTVLSPEYQAFWNVQIREDTSAKGLWKTKQGGSFWAGGFGSPIVGYGAGKMPVALKKSLYPFGGAIIIDDPLKEQDRHRALVRNEMLSFFNETLPTRKNSPKVPIILIMQPLHPEDLGQYIKKYKAEDYRIIEFPIINEKGEPLFPEVYTKKDIEKLRVDLGSEMFNAKCLLRPIKLGGNILKTNFLKYYKELPFLKYRWIEADTAQKDEERHDYTVFQCWGKGYEGGIYLIDSFRKKVKYSELKQSFKDFWNKHNDVETYNPRRLGYMKAAYVEDKSSGTQIIQESILEGNIPIVAVPRSRSKYERAMDIALPKLEAGYINFPMEASFLADLKDELESFTGHADSKQAILKMDRKKTFDDQVDCFISACEHGFTEILTSNDVAGSFMKNKMRKRK